MRAARVEVRGEGDDAEQEQHADDRDHELLQRDDGRVAVERDDGDLGRDQRVADRERAVVRRRPQQPVGARDERVARGPDGDRGVGQGERERQRRAHEAAGDAEVRAGRHRVVRPRARPEQGERRGDHRAEREAERRSRSPSPTSRARTSPAATRRRSPRTRGSRRRTPPPGSRAASRARPRGCTRPPPLRSGPARSATAVSPYRDRRHDAAEYVRLKIQSRSCARYGAART